MGAKSEEKKGMTQAECMEKYNHCDAYDYPAIMRECSNWYTTIIKQCTKNMKKEMATKDDTKSEEEKVDKDDDEATKDNTKGAPPKDDGKSEKAKDMTKE